MQEWMVLGMGYIEVSLCQGCVLIERELVYVLSVNLRLSVSLGTRGRSIGGNVLYIHHERLRCVCVSK